MRSAPELSTGAGTAGPGGAPPAAAAARAPLWRRGLRNGGVMALLALAAILLLNAEELPGLGRILSELPAAVAISAAVHLPQILLTAAAWRALLPRGGERPPFGAMATLRWFRESANALLPAGAIVGQAAAARLLARRGVPAEVAGATATVDLTMEAVSQFVFTFMGVALLLAGSAEPALAGAAAAGLGVAALGALAMLLAQRRLGPLERLLERLSRRWPALRPDWIRELQAAVLRLHADRAALALSVLWHGAAWALGAVEVMAVLHLLGHPVSLADALVIESLAQALRNAGFMLPGALAVQEGAIIGAAALVGVPPAAALAAALVRRAREVCFALPGLLAWHRSETRGMRAPQRQPSAAREQE
jgi:putative membrane protein